MHCLQNNVLNLNLNWLLALSTSIFFACHMIGALLTPCIWCPLRWTITNDWLWVVQEGEYSALESVLSGGSSSTGRERGRGRDGEVGGGGATAHEEAGLTSSDLALLERMYKRPSASKKLVSVNSSSNIPIAMSSTTPTTDSTSKPSNQQLGGSHGEDHHSERSASGKSTVAADVTQKGGVEPHAQPMLERRVTQPDGLDETKEEEKRKTRKRNEMQMHIDKVRSMLCVCCRGKNCIVSYFVLSC
jgi:hypothetical protein